jgi:uncharacterized protein involved in exopolysaccharide biosynthesis
MPETNCPKEKEIVYAYPPFPVGENREDEIDLVELWRVVWSGKFFIIAFVIFCTLVAGVVSFVFLPEIYESSATLIPVEQENSSLSSISGLLGNLPGPISFPGQQDSSNIMSFLKSRSLKERLITKYNLLPVLFPDLWDSKTKDWVVDNPEDKPTLIFAIQEEILEKYFLVNQDNKTELINISWSGEDPAFCSLMLERVINELTFFLENEYVSDAKREREFTEGQLSKATVELEYWERQVPSEKLSLSKITRERLASQTIYTELRKQLELAKINEAKKLETFEVLDKPYVPEKPFKPQKLFIIALTFVAAFLVALFGVFFLNFIRNLKQDETPVAET